jgi:hypothetical protein
MNVKVSFSEKKDNDGKIVGSIVNFTAEEGTYNSTSSSEVDFDSPVDSMDEKEVLKKLDLTSIIKSLKDDLVNKGANITKLTISLQI